MSEHVRMLSVGATKVAVIDVGDLDIGTLRDNLVIPPGEESPEDSPRIDQRMALPLLCVHVGLRGSSLLVDAGFDDPSAASPYQPPECVRTIGLVEGLAEAGVRPEDVTHLVVTHAHGDHYAGLTVERDGALVPRFPNARVYIGLADWDTVKERALAGNGSLEARTLGLIERRGMLSLLEQDVDLADGIRVLLTPGESPGHLVVRVESGGEVLYCLGDLFHDPVEVAHPTWMFPRRDPEAMLISRDRIAQAALAENALLVASHIDGVGRLEKTAAGVRWAPVAP